MNKEELISYIDELHHNRDSYSRSKLLELIKNKINSYALLESQSVSENEVKEKVYVDERLKEATERYSFGYGCWGMD